MKELEYKKANSVLIKPGYDGRLVYFEVGIKKHLDAWGDAINQNNFNQQFIALKAYHILTAPYIKNEFNNIILKQFKKINQILVIKDETIRMSAASLLSKVAYDLFNFSRHLMLPQDMEEKEDVDWEVFKE